MPQRNLKKTSLQILFKTAQWLWAIIEWQNNKFRTKPIILKTKIWNVSSFSTGDCMPRRNLRPVGWWRLSTFNNLLSEKCPIIMNNLLNGNFRDMYCCETFKVEEITIQKSRSGNRFQCHEEIWRKQVLRILFENAQ